MEAVVVALIADSAAVTFGAVGMPLLIGLDQGLNNATPELIQEVVILTSLMGIFVAVFLPLLLVLIVTKFFGQSSL